MEFRVLRYFLTVAREGSITKAATFLHVTQPTLSRQLKDLEDELGKKLFVRKSHHVVLTEEGQLLKQRAEEIMDMVVKVEKEFDSMTETVVGDIYIGGGETKAMRMVAEIVHTLQAKYPKIKYHFYSGNADDVMSKLDQGLLDFGVLIQPADLSKYHALNLPGKDVWGVVMRKDSPLAKKESIQKVDLLEVPLLLSRQAIQTELSHNEFSAWFGEDFEQLNIAATYNLIYNATLLVEEGIGYAITLDKLANTSSDSNLCFKPLEPHLESGLNIVWKKHQVFSRAASLFFDEIQRKFSAT